MQNTKVVFVISHTRAVSDNKVSHKDQICAISDLKGLSMQKRFHEDNISENF